jgi:hypothetical protein
MINSITFPTFNKSNTNTQNNYITFSVTSPSTESPETIINVGSNTSDVNWQGILKFITNSSLYTFSSFTFTNAGATS